MMIDKELDRICRRQTARFMDHLRAKNQLSWELETDISRMMNFTFSDVKKAIHEHSKELSHETKEKL